MGNCSSLNIFFFNKNVQYLLLKRFTPNNGLIKGKKGNLKMSEPNKKSYYHVRIRGKIESVSWFRNGYRI